MYPMSSGTNKSSKSSSTNPQNQNNYQQQQQQQQQQHTLNDTFSNLFQLNQFNLFNTNTNNLFFPPFTPPTAPHVPPSTAGTHATPKPKKSKESQKSQQSADHHHHGSNKSLAIDPFSSIMNMNNNNSSFDLFNFYQNQFNSNLNDFLMNPTLLAAAAAASAPPTTPSQTIQTTPYSVKDLIEPSKQQNPSQSHNNMQQGSLYDLNLWTAMLQTAAASLFAPQSMQQQQQQQLESQGQLDLMQLNQFYNMNQHESKPSSKVKTTTTAVHQTNDSHATTNTGNPTSDEIKKNDVAKIKYPLKLKWRRETVVKEIHKNGIRGDVIYYSPCGKKLRTFQEIERYLLKHNIKNLCRDNFTFSSKYIVGMFLLPVVQKHHDQAATSQTSNYKIHNEDQIVMKIKEVNPHFSRKSTTTTTQAESNLVLATANPKKLKTSPTEFKEIKIQKAAMNEQKLQRQEQQLHERQKQLQQEQQLQNELLIKQQTIAAANLQLEQKRLLNERKMEERQEQSERKIKEKWFESIVSREFKKQIDDMQERFLVDLPTFKEIPQHAEQFKSKVKIEIKIENECPTEHTDDKSQPIECQGHASVENGQGTDKSTHNFIGDCLMVIEFLNNFKGDLELDCDSLKLVDLQKALDKPTCKQIEKLLNDLLKLCIDDGDLIDANEVQTNNGQKLCDLHINKHNYSELLRIYLNAKLIEQEECIRNSILNEYLSDDYGKIRKICDRLNVVQFMCLNRYEKIKCIAYLCNDLLTSKRCCDRIESTLDILNKSRQEKWHISSKIRSITLQGGNHSTSTNQHQQQAADDSANNDDTNHVQEEPCTSDKQQIVADLTKRQQSLKKQISITQRKLRNGIYLGQDRYKRSYWILSRCGGVYIESYNNDYSYLNTTCVKSVDDDETMKSESEDTFETGEIPLDLSVKKSQQTKPDLRSFIDDLEEGEIKRPINLANDLIEVPNQSQWLVNSYLQPNIQLNMNSKLLKKINYKQMEAIIVNYLQHKQPQPIDKTEFMDSKWWLIDEKSKFIEFDKCLAKRGIRERHLAKIFCNFRDLLLDETEEIYKSLREFLAIGNTTADQQSDINSDANEQQQHTTSEPVKLNKRIKMKASDHDLKYKYEYELLNMVYDLEDRIYNANLQAKADTNASDATTFNNDTNGTRSNNNNDDDDDDLSKPFDLAKQRLTSLELNIERRYLKMPFFNLHKNNLIVDDLNQNDDTSASMDEDKSTMDTNDNGDTIDDDAENADDENPKSESTISTTNTDSTPQLQQWRNAVKNAQSTSQLAICVEQLDEAINWDKSIMKVICQICNCNDNEDKLLLCDNCDHGYHTYCFKPIIKRIPDGNWYCHVCIGKSKGEKLCFVCGTGQSSSSTSHEAFVKCSKCVKMFHSICLSGAKQKSVKNSKWLCVVCASPNRPSNKVNRTKNSKTNASVRKQKMDASRSNGKEDVTDGTKKPTESNSNGTILTSTSKRSAATIATNNILNTNVRRSKSVGKKDNGNLFSKKDKNASVKRKTDDDNASESDGSDANMDNTDLLPEKKKQKNSKSNDTKSNSASDNKRKRGRPSAGRGSNNETHTHSDARVILQELKQCKRLINELSKDENALPFLKAVSIDDYPLYNEIIKQPMDIETIKDKIKLDKYSTKEDFAFDCRLIFDNCFTFNEDDSPIGRAGQKLRVLFETKWIKLFD